MSLTSASTLAQVEAQYDDNADYREAGSASKARDFAQAARILLRRYQTSVTGAEGGGFTRSISVIKDALDEAVAWIDANDDSSGNTGGVVLPDFGNLRQ